MDREEKWVYFFFLFLHCNNLTVRFIVLDEVKFVKKVVYFYLLLGTS